MTDPLPGQPIQIQLPPVLQDIMQQWPVLVQRVTTLEVAPPPVQSTHSTYGLLAVAAYTLGLLSFIAGQWAWGKWGF